MTQVLAAGFAANVGVSVGIIAFATILSFREYRRKTDTIQQNINTLARRDFDEARENQRIALDRPVREMTPFEFNLLELRDYQVLAELGR
jgi:hypothetical protein